MLDVAPASGGTINITSAARGRLRQNSQPANRTISKVRCAASPVQVAHRAAAISASLVTCSRKAKAFMIARSPGSPILNVTNRPRINVRTISTTANPTGDRAAGLASASTISSTPDSITARL